MSNLRPIITLLTDFGEMYPAAMKGVILGIAPESIIVDVSHSIPPHDIVAGALALQAAVPYFPKGTVHIAVVDPGVGTARNCMVLWSNEHALIGPDNGLLLPAARRLASDGVFDVYRIENWYSLFKVVHPTFHGRDVFAPAAAHIALNDGIVKLSHHPGYIDLEFGEPNEIDGEFELDVIYVDSFGNLVTNASREWIEEHLKAGQAMEIDGHDIAFALKYDDADDMAVLPGSHGYLEVAVKNGNAARRLGVSRGDKIRFGL